MMSNSESLLIDWSAVETDPEPLSFRLIEARVLVLLLRLTHPEATKDISMASAQERHRAIAADARWLWAEIRTHKGSLNAILSTDASSKTLADALRALEHPWAEYLGETHGAYVPADVTQGLALFGVQVHGTCR